MEPREFFLDQRVALPLQGAPDLPAVLRVAFGHYVEALSEIRPSTKLSAAMREARGDAEALGDGLVETLRHFLAGRHVAAMARFCACVDAVRPHLEHMCGWDILPATMGSWYRMRHSEVDDVRSIGDMFHVPFQDRHKVSQTRFSAPGVPCLYLSSSTYACWHELQRPRLDRCWVSMFRAPPVTAAFNILNVPYHPLDLNALAVVADGREAAAEKMTRLRSFLQSFAVVWPLVAACTASCHSPAARFNIEYVVPQMLMQWICSDKAGKRIHGVRYLSSRCPALVSLGLRVNLALPALSESCRGFSQELGTAWFLTAPMRCMDIAAHSSGATDDISADACRQLSHDADAYEKTHFYAAETAMHGLPLMTVLGSY